MEKYNKLLKYLTSLKEVAVAFSGGVDSTFVLHAAKEALGEKVMAIMVIAPYTPKWEVEEGKEILEEMGIKHIFIEVPMLEDIRFSPKDRCYICKKAVFSNIQRVAKEHGIQYVLDGTNFDDTRDYRPGLRALKELNIKSPLLECEIGKAEIRSLSKVFGLKTHNKPAYACLLSRIPYDQEVKFEDLERIEKSEVYLMNLGFIGVRVRSHMDLARIEFSKEDLEKMDMELMTKISRELKSYGYKYVTLDMEGYRMGSLN